MKDYAYRLSTQLQSIQVKRTPQDYINELSIRTLHWFNILNIKPISHIFKTYVKLFKAYW